MGTRSRLRIAFSPPEHGWLQLSIEATGARVDIDASHTPDDPIRQLIDALYAATRGNVLTLDGTPRDILLPFWRFLCRFRSGEPHGEHWPAIDYRDLDVIADRLRHPQSRDAEPAPQESH